MQDVIVVNEKNCWICGKPADTKHHALPQHLRPIKNVILPICNDCHKNKINNNDISGMYAYAYKLEQMSLQTRNGAYRLIKMLKNNKNVNMPNVQKEPPVIKD